MTANKTTNTKTPTPCSCGDTLEVLEDGRCPTCSAMPPDTVARISAGLAEHVAAGLALPSIAAIVADLRDVVTDLPKHEETDVRLCVEDDGSWVVRSGDVSFDTRHSPYVGASSVASDYTLADLRETAQELRDGVENQWHELADERAAQRARDEERAKVEAARAACDRTHVDESTDPDDALRILRRWYYGEIRSLAEEVERLIGLPEGDPSRLDDAEEVDTWLHETVDGHSFVIYTFKAQCALLASDNEDAMETEQGDETGTPEQRAYYAMRADLVDATDVERWLEERDAREDDAEDVTKCPTCERVTHASESDDEGRCEVCIVAAKGEA